MKGAKCFGLSFCVFDHPELSGPGHRIVHLGGYHDLERESPADVELALLLEERLRKEGKKFPRPMEFLKSFLRRKG